MFVDARVYVLGSVARHAHPLHFPIVGAVRGTHPLPLLVVAVLLELLEGSGCALSLAGVVEVVIGGVIELGLGVSSGSPLRLLCSEHVAFLPSRTTIAGSGWRSYGATSRLTLYPDLLRVDDRVDIVLPPADAPLSVLACQSVEFLRADIDEASEGRLCPHLLLVPPRLTHLAIDLNR